MSILNTLSTKAGHGKNIEFSEIVHNVLVDGFFAVTTATITKTAARFIQTASSFQVSLKLAGAFGATNAVFDTAIEVLAPKTFDRLNETAMTAIKATVTGIGSWAALNYLGYALSAKQAALLGAGSYVMQFYVKDC